MKKITTTFVASFAMLALAYPIYAAGEKKMTTDTQQQAGSQYQEGQRDPLHSKSDPSADLSQSKSTQMAGASQSQSAKDIKGFQVFSESGEEIGEITEVRTDKQSGEVQYVTVTKGGVIGIGGKDIAVPLGAFMLDRENKRATLTVSEAMLENAPTQADKSDQDFQRELSSHYGIAPVWEETPKTGETQMDQSQKPVPDPVPGLETGSPEMRDKSKQLE
jgi:sporulation protein YlmC with PRC-barrel domain